MPGEELDDAKYFYSKHEELKESDPLLSGIYKEKHFEQMVKYYRDINPPFARMYQQKADLLIAERKKHFKSQASSKPQTQSTGNTQHALATSLMRSVWGPPLAPLTASMPPASRLPVAVQTFSDASSTSASATSSAAGPENRVFRGRGRRPEQTAADSDSNLARVITAATAPSYTSSAAASAAAPAMAGVKRQRPSSEPEPSPTAASATSSAGNTSPTRRSYGLRDKPRHSYAKAEPFLTKKQRIFKSTFSDSSSEPELEQPAKKAPLTREEKMERRFMEDARREDLAFNAERSRALYDFFPESDSDSEKESKPPYIPESGAPEPDLGRCAPPYVQAALQESMDRVRAYAEASQQSGSDYVKPGADPLYNKSLYFRKRLEEESKKADGPVGKSLDGKSR